MARGAWRMSGYRVEELLGAGSSGEVWRARVNSTGVPVALKRIWLSGREQRDTALSEAAILSALDHPHLMKLHDVRHVDDDAIVLVLDLAGGGSLASLLARRGRLTVGETITAIAPIAAALAYAHGNGVVHGDVSAANVLFTDIGLPLLADLGVARLLGEVAPVRTTPAYADPIVAAGGLPTTSSDVFMVAAVALHALTGAPPWPGSDPQDVLDAALSGEEPDFARRMTAAGIAQPVIAAVARAMSIDPSCRGTAADFSLELRHAGEPVAVELTAGRARVLAPTGSPNADSWPLQSVPAVSPSGADPAPVRVPPFARAPLTYGVRAPSPFTGAPPGRHLARGSRPRVATGLVACVALIALAVVAGAVLWWPGDSGAVRHAGAALSPSALSPSVPVTRGVT
ncbi:MAG: protein kinase domain-containing protein, partial [Jatrophihabitantaceae bacterium]